MKTIPIDYSAQTCPCCRAPRRADVTDEWPWSCQCNMCEVASMGLTCGGAGECWDGCPYKAPDGGCTAPTAAR